MLRWREIDNLISDFHQARIRDTALDVKKTCALGKRVLKWFEFIAEEDREGIIDDTRSHRLIIGDFLSHKVSPETTYMMLHYRYGRVIEAYNNTSADRYHTIGPRLMKRRVV